MPAYHRALQFLQELYERQGGDVRHSRLPTIRILASQAGVSRGTMQKAVLRLVEKGHLSARPGQGIWTVSEQGPDSLGGAVPQLRVGSGWERLRDTLMDGIVGGDFSAGEPLPPIAALCSRYGVCYRTMRRALQSLLSSGILCRHGRAYSVSQLPRNSRITSLVLIVGQAPGPHPALNSARTADLFRVLETECSRLNIRLIVLVYECGQRRLYSVDPADKRGVDILKLQARTPLMGYVVWTAFMSMPDSVAPLLGDLLLTGSPVAVLDETRNTDILPPSLLRNPRMHRIRMGCTPTCGRAVGQYLVRMGHRRAVYLAPLHHEWSQQRLRGLRAAFAEMGEPEGVVVCTSSEAPTLAAYVANHRDTADKVSGLIDDFARSAREDRATDSHMVGGTIDALREHVEVAFARQAFRRTLSLLMNSALRKDDATVWVAASDEVARVCIEFLGHNGKRVPQDISVVGFDDCLEACLAQITSYNFNLPAVVRVILNHIMDTDNRRSAPATLPAEVEGFLTQRRSVAPILSVKPPRGNA